MSVGAWRIGAPAMLCCAGLLMTISSAAARGGDLRPGRYDDVEDLIRAQNSSVARLEAKTEELRLEVEALGKSSREPEVAAAQAQAARLEAAAGLTAMSGPGVTVSLDDAPLPGGSVLPAGATYDDYVVHQQDVEGVINALWAGGASAVTVMGRRLISTSAVRCVGNVLILDGQVYSPPFTVAAIGNARSLRRALDESTAVSYYRAWAEEIGLGYDVKSLPNVDAPAYEGSLGVALAEVGAN